MKKFLIILLVVSIITIIGGGFYVYDRNEARKLEVEKQSLDVQKKSLEQAKNEAWRNNLITPKPSTSTPNIVVPSTPRITTPTVPVPKLDSTLTVPKITMPR